MGSADLLDALRRDGAVLAGAARRTDSDAPVPGLAWSLRQFVVHAGAVHRC